MNGRNFLIMKFFLESILDILALDFLRLDLLFFVLHHHRRNIFTLNPSFLIISQAFEAISPLVVSKWLGYQLFVIVKKIFPSEVHCPDPHNGSFQILLVIEFQESFSFLNVRFILLSLGDLFIV